MTNARALGKLAQQADINTPILDDEMNKLLNHCELIKRTQLLTLWWQGWYDGLYEDAEKKESIHVALYSRVKQLNK